MVGVVSLQPAVSPLPRVSQTRMADLLPLKHKRLQPLSPFPPSWWSTLSSVPVGFHLLAPQPPEHVDRLGKCVSPAGSQ